VVPNNRSALDDSETIGPFSLRKNWQEQGIKLDSSARALGEVVSIKK
jgi:hypothetical protein